jgi:hypothetical protein
MAVSSAAPRTPAMNLKRNALIAGGADQARAAALRLVPGGTANAVERDGEKGATWEVEVRAADGSTVDVRLGASYEKVAIDPDSERN